jgi:hypothetical protein
MRLTIKRRPESPGFDAKKRSLSKPNSLQIWKEVSYVAVVFGLLRVGEI